MSSEIILKSGKLYKDGKIEEAKALLIPYIKEHSNDATVWYALSFCVDDLHYKQKCLEQVLKFSPHHQKARVTLEKLNGQLNRGEIKTEKFKGKSPSLKNDPAMEEQKFKRKKAGESTIQMGDKRRKKV